MSEEWRSTKIAACVRAGNETVAHIPSGENRKKHALLIAAAPELIEAARESADTLDEIAGEFGFHNVIMDAIARLREAILKADGPR